jgi:hypothetical protein
MPQLGKRRGGRGRGAGDRGQEAAAVDHGFSIVNRDYIRLQFRFHLPPSVDKEP